MQRIRLKGTLSVYTVMALLLACAVPASAAAAAGGRASGGTASGGAASGGAPGNAFNELAQGGGTSEEEPTTSTPKTSSTSSSESTSSSSKSSSTSTVLWLGLGASAILLGGIAFVILRDARRVAPVGDGPVMGRPARDPSVALRKRRAQAKAARRQRKRNR